MIQCSVSRWVVRLSRLCSVSSYLVNPLVTNALMAFALQVRACPFVLPFFCPFLVDVISRWASNNTSRLHMGSLPHTIRTYICLQRICIAIPDLPLA